MTAVDPDGRPLHGWPIVYQDVMRVVIAGELNAPRVGINRAVQGDVPLVLSIDEARELAAALDWAIGEYQAKIGVESFYPRHPLPKRRGRPSNG